MSADAGRYRGIQYVVVYAGKFGVKDRYFVLITDFKTALQGGS